MRVASFTRALGCKEGLSAWWLMSRGFGFAAVVTRHERADGAYIGGRWRGLVDHPAFTHHEDAIGEGEDLVEVGADQEHSRAAISGGAQAGVDLGDRFEVEAHAGVRCDQD